MNTPLLAVNHKPYGPPRLAGHRDLFFPSCWGLPGGSLAEQGHRSGLLSGRTEPWLVGDRRIDLRLQHWFRAHRRLGRVRGERRRGHGPLRTACVVPARAGLGVVPFYMRLAGVHDAGVPRATVFHRVALRALDRFDHHVHPLQDRRRHFCGRRRFWNIAAGAADQYRRACDRQLLDRLDRRNRSHRLYTSLGGMRAVAYNDAFKSYHPHRWFGPPDILRSGQAGRMARAEDALRVGHVQLWKRLFPRVWPAPGRR